MVGELRLEKGFAENLVTVLTEEQKQSFVSPGCLILSIILVVMAYQDARPYCTKPVLCDNSLLHKTVLWNYSLLHKTCFVQ